MKKKNEKHTHTKTVNSICSWKISGFLLGNLRLPLYIFDSLRTSSVVFGISILWQSTGICVSRRKSSETSTLGRRIITRMWGILCQAHTTAILDRIGIWKCWFLISKRGKPEYPEKNLSEQERDSTNSTHTMWTFKVYRDTPGLHREN